MRIRLFLLISALLAGQLTWAQHFTFTDSAYVDEIGDTGRVEYVYRINGIEEELKDGPYNFSKSTQKDSAGLNVINQIYRHGSYRNDRKTGEWKYATTKSLVSLVGVSQGKLDYRIFSYRQVVTGTYKRGLPNGTWEYTSIKVLPNGDSTELAHFTVFFTDGKIDGTVSGFSSVDGEKVAVLGEVTKGIMDGGWRINYVTHSELRLYKRGILLQLLEVDEFGDTLFALEYPLSPLLQKAIEEDEWDNVMQEPYRLRFNDGYHRTSKYITKQTPGNNIISILSKGIFKYQSALISSTGHPLGTTRGIYPLSKEEQQGIKDWFELNETYISQLGEVVQSFVDSNEIKDDSLLFAVRWAYKKLPEAMEVEAWVNEWVRFKLEYYYREGIVLDSAVKALARDSFRFEGLTTVVDYDSDTIKAENLIFYLRDNYEARIRRTSELLEIFHEKITTLQVANRTKRIQAAILEKREILDTLLAVHFSDPSIDRLIDAVHDRFLDDAVGIEYDAFIKQSDDIQHQLVLGDSLIQELKVIGEIYMLCEKLVTRRHHIDTLYTEFVFDPFTYTDQIPSRIKKRLYQQIAIQLFDDMVEVAMDAEDVYVCLNTLQQLYYLQGELIFMRRANTKTLEKQLRKTKDLKGRIKLIRDYGKD